MSIRILLLSCLISSICFAEADELWTFDEGYMMAEMYCVPNGLSLALEHVSYWKEMGQIDYAEGMEERLSFCAISGAFTPGGSNATINDAICDTGIEDNWPSVFNFACGDDSDDSDNGNP